MASRVPEVELIEQSFVSGTDDPALSGQPQWPRRDSSQAAVKMSYKTGLSIRLARPYRIANAEWVPIFSDRKLILPIPVRFHFGVRSADNIWTVRRGSGDCRPFDELVAILGTQLEYNPILFLIFPLHAFDRAKCTALSGGTNLSLNGRRSAFSCAIRPLERILGTSEAVRCVKPEIRSQSKRSSELELFNGH